MAEGHPAISSARAQWSHAFNLHREVILMAAAQLVSSFITVAAKIVQSPDEQGRTIDPEQVLLVMMSIVTVATWCWMAFWKIPHSPLGQREVRPALLFRGVAGIFGIFGFYISLHTLPLAEAIIINFLAPILAIFASALLSKGSITLPQVLAGITSIVGVVLVAQPWHLGTSSTHRLIRAPYPMPTPTQHLQAVGAGLVGALGGATSYTAIALIGERAHPAIVVFYYGTITTLAASASCAFQSLTSARLVAPSVEAWGLLLFLGAACFLLHMLLTASLQGHASSRALNTIYIQVVFALAVDKVVWGHTPTWLSLIGSTLILGSVAAVAVLKRSSSGTDVRPVSQVSGLAVAGVAVPLALQAQAQNLLSQDEVEDADVETASGVDRNATENLARV